MGQTLQQKPIISEWRTTDSFSASRRPPIDCGGRPVEPPKRGNAKQQNRCCTRSLKKAGQWVLPRSIRIVVEQDETALYYATLMRVAEDELGIDIEKKPPWPGPLPSHPGHVENTRSPFDSAVRRMSASAVRLVLAVRRTISIGNATGRKLITRLRSLSW